jgi:hypothetical protein
VAALLRGDLQQKCIKYACQFQGHRTVTLQHWQLELYYPPQGCAHYASEPLSKELAVAGVAGGSPSPSSTRRSIRGQPSRKLVEGSAPEARSQSLVPSGSK